MTEESGLIYRKDGNLSCAYGRDAVNMVGAAGIAAFLRLYAKSGIRPTRGVGPKELLRRASLVTGKRYPLNRAGYLKAADDVSRWVQEMKAALPQETQ